MYNKKHTQKLLNKNKMEPKSVRLSQTIGYRKSAPFKKLTLQTMKTQKKSEIFGMKVQDLRKAHVWSDNEKI